MARLILLKMAEVDSLLIKQCLLKIIKYYWSLTLQVSFKQKSVTVNRGPPKIFSKEGERGVSELFFPSLSTHNIL